jgi:hypothetical protein
MYTERNVFYLHFGKSSQALALWKSFLQTVQDNKNDLHLRLLTDITGTSYTLVLELNYSTFAELEPSRCRLTQSVEWKEFYQQFIPLCKSSERTLYRTEISF